MKIFTALALLCGAVFLPGCRTGPEEYAAYHPLDYGTLRGVPMPHDKMRSPPDGPPGNPGFLLPPR